MNPKTASLTRIGLEEIVQAQMHLKDVITRTPLQYNRVLSERYNCNVLLKREDLQIVRSFKIRGAYRSMRSLGPETLEKGVVCASAGNHAQGVAYSCQTLGIPGDNVAAATKQIKAYGCEIISDPGVIPVKFRAPGGTVCELVPKGRYKKPAARKNAEAKR